jgi:hypothetical protein
MAAVVEDVGIGCEDPIAEPVVAHELPEVLVLSLSKDVGEPDLYRPARSPPCGRGSPFKSLSQNSRCAVAARGKYPVLGSFVRSSKCGDGVRVLSVVARAGGELAVAHALQAPAQPARVELPVTRASGGPRRHGRRAPTMRRARRARARSRRPRSRPGSPCPRPRGRGSCPDP